MPINVNLANAIRAKEQRKIIKNNFYNQWVALPDNSQYVTADGVHLIYESAYKFSKKFMESVKYK